MRCNRVLQNPCDSSIGCTSIPEIFWYVTETLALCSKLARHRFRMKSFSFKQSKNKKRILIEPRGWLTSSSAIYPILILESGTWWNNSIILGCCCPLFLRNGGTHRRITLISDLITRSVAYNYFYNTDCLDTSCFRFFLFSPKKSISFNLLYTAVYDQCQYSEREHHVQLVHIWPRR